MRGIAEILQHQRQLELENDELRNLLKGLRDEFAMAALIGLGSKNYIGFSLDTAKHVYAGMAKYAYEIADAMMEARTKVLDEDTSPRQS